MEVRTATAFGAGAGKPGLLGRIRPPRLAHQPDEQLVALTRLGHPAALDALFARYRARLVRFSEHLLGANWPDAEDVVQEAMIAASEAMVADERRIDVGPWLYRITRNRSLSYLRDQATTRRPPLTGAGNDYLEQAADSGASPAELAERSETLRVLVDDVRSLPETQRTAIVLRELDGLSYEQVANVMRTTVSSVKSLLVRGRLSLVDIAGGRELDCTQVRLALAAAEQRLGGLDGAERAHVRSCDACARVRKRLRTTTHGLAVLAPVGLAPVPPLIASAVAGGGSAAGGSGAAGAVAGGGGGAAAGGLLAGGGAFAMKGLLAAVTAGVVAVGGYSATVNGPGAGKVVPVATSQGTVALPGAAAWATERVRQSSEPAVAESREKPKPVIVEPATPPVQVVAEAAVPTAAVTDEAPGEGSETDFTANVEGSRGYPGEEPTGEQPPPQEPPPVEPTPPAEPTPPVEPAPPADSPGPGPPSA